MFGFGLWGSSGGDDLYFGTRFGCMGAARLKPKEPLFIEFRPIVKPRPYPMQDELVGLVLRMDRDEGAEYRGVLPHWVGILLTIELEEAGDDGIVQAYGCQEWVESLVLAWTRPVERIVIRMLIFSWDETDGEIDQVRILGLDERYQRTVRPQPWKPRGKKQSHLQRTTMT